MATIYDLFEVTDISEATTYSASDGSLMGIVDGASSADLDDGEFDEGDSLSIDGTTYTIDLIQEPESSGQFTLDDGTQESFGPGDEDNLSVTFLTISNGAETRHFIIPNDSFGDFNVQSITTGDIEDVGGNDSATVSTVDNDVNVVCFVSGTMIETPQGPVPIEDLRVGDQVLTRDHGAQDIRMIFVRDLDFSTAPDKLKPIAFEPSSLGGGRPNRRLCVSPQHRVLVTDPEGHESLVPAKSLIDCRGVRVMRGKRRITYFHLVFDRHEIILSDGVFTESFFPGPMALSAISQSARAEVTEIFGLDTGEPAPARPSPAAPTHRVQEAKARAQGYRAAGLPVFMR